MGSPPMVYVSMRRVDRAKLMITSTGQTLTEIALACGFADQSHLNRCFSRLIGVSPGKWRRHMTERDDAKSKTHLSIGLEQPRIRRDLGAAPLATG
jgi:transcriptional regulator GlxA family with amidase domain